MNYVDTARRTSRSATINGISIDGGVASIAIENRSRGFVGLALVDVADVPLLRAFGRRWRAAWHSSTGQYMVLANAKIQGRWTQVLLHRLLMNAPAGIDVDHVNHSMLDCRRSNMRCCSRSQNLQNRRGAMARGRSGIRGVSLDTARGQWTAHVTVNRRTIHLGRFTTREEAASAARQGRAKHMTHSAECV